MIIIVHRYFLILILLILTLPMARAGEAEDRDKTAEEFKKYQFETVTTKEGLRFEVPPDMPIQRKGGLVQPVEFNQYLYVKFKMMEERIGKLEKQMTEMQKQLFAKLDELKAQQAETILKLDSALSAGNLPAGQAGAESQQAA